MNPTCVKGYAFCSPSSACRDCEQAELRTLRSDHYALKMSVESIVKHGGKLQAEIVELCAEIKDRAAERDKALLQIHEIPKKILAAVNAEQLRCGLIAEVFWNADEKLNADLRVNLTQAEKSMAYMISTQIRAMRWCEENFTDKRKHDGHVHDQATCTNYLCREALGLPHMPTCTCIVCERKGKV